MSHQLDARRLLCPLPLIRTQNLVKGLPAGDLVEVWCTDPGVLSDIPAWCRVQGHEYLGSERTGREIVLRVRVGASKARETV